MSTIVKSVYDALKSAVSTELGSSWTELRFLFDVEGNDRRTAERGFGVIPLEAVSNPTILQAYTFDQTFEVILTRTNPREIDDTDKINALLNTGELYDEASNIHKAILRTQIGIPAVINLVQEVGMNAPEFTENFIVLRFQFNIRWREIIT